MEEKHRELQQEMGRLKGEAAAAKEANAASQREVSRLSSLVTTKEAEIQTLRSSLEGEKNQRLHLQGELVETFETHKEVGVF